MRDIKLLNIKLRVYFLLIGVFAFLILTIYSGVKSIIYSDVISIARLYRWITLVSISTAFFMLSVASSEVFKQKPNSNINVIRKSFQFLCDYLFSNSFLLLFITLFAIHYTITSILYPKIFNNPYLIKLNAFIISTLTYIIHCLLYKDRLDQLLKEYFVQSRFEFNEYFKKITLFAIHTFSSIITYYLISHSILFPQNTNLDIMADIGINILFIWSFLSLSYSLYYSLSYLYRNTSKPIQ